MTSPTIAAVSCRPETTASQFSRRSKMNTNEPSAIGALDTIQNIPEWLRAVSNTATHLRRDLDLLEERAARFRTILDSARQRRALGLLAELRNEGSGLIAAIAQSAALMRRFQAAFERWCPASAPATASASTELPTRVGSLTLTYVPVFERPNGALLSFTRTEERLLAALWAARGSTVAGAELTARVWRSQRVPQKTLSVHLSHLRKKLDEFGVIIEFVQGAGYRMVLESGVTRG